MAFPLATIVGEDAGLEYNLIGDGEDLGRGVGSTTGGGIVDGIFDLAEEGFNWKIDIIACFHGHAVGLDISCVDVSVGLVQMGKLVQWFTGGEINEREADGLEVNLVDGRNDQSGDGFLNILVRVENACGFVENESNVGNLWALCTSGENGGTKGVADNVL